MAEIQTENSKKRGIVQFKKLSTRVDLTPMVDLGFLMITFFVFTTALSKPTALGLNLPADPKNIKDFTDAPESKTLTLLLSGNEKVIYYQGLAISKAERTDYSSLGLRHIILEKMTSVEKRFGNKSQTIILIKPTEYSNFKNIVDVLDEMKINNVKRFVLMEANQQELNIAKNL